MNNIHIREAEINDIPGIQDIFIEWFNFLELEEVEKNAQYSVDLIEQSISKKSTDASEQYIVAVNENGVVVGVLGYRHAIPKWREYCKTENPLEIYVLFVSKKHTQKKIGTMLINYIKNYASREKYTEIIVRSASVFDETGWRFYPHVGFEERAFVPTTGNEGYKIFGILVDVCKH